MMLKPSAAIVFAVDLNQPNPSWKMTFCFVLVNLRSGQGSVSPARTQSMTLFSEADCGGI
jgi:hypothetical protein